MATFVLVHGSGQHAGCWSRVAAALRAHGHQVAAPDLPKARRDWGLEQHAAETARAVPAGGAVVVAHSLSGAFLPLVPQYASCRLLVFMAAVIPEPGLSVRQQFAADASMFHPQWIAAGARWTDVSQRRALAIEFLFHDCDEASLPWALDTVQSYDTQRIITQPSPLQRWPDAPSAAIVASRDRTLTADWCRRQSRRAFGRDAVELDSGHCPQCSQPDLLAAVLEQLAQSAAD